MTEGLTVSAKLLQQEAEFEKDKNAMKKDRETAERMMSIFEGYDDGGYDPDTRSALREEGRHLPQFNIVKTKITKLTGNLVKDFLDKDFVPVSSKETKWTRTLKGMYLSDKNHFEYDRSSMNCALFGLIHSGCEYMYIDTKFNNIGNIAFKNLNPANIIIDPNWKSDITSDIEVVWAAKYLTAKQISQIYGHKSDRINDLIQRQVLHGMSRYGEGSTVMPFQNVQTAYGDLHRLIEKHYLEITGRDVEYVIVGSGEESNQIALPGTDHSTNKDFVDRNGLTDKINRTLKRRVFKKEYRIQTSCLSLDPDEFIEDRAAEIQIERLPFFPWSAERFNGRNVGKVQGLEDPQNILNKREELATAIIESSAMGAHLVDPILFGADMSLARASIKEFNKANANIFTAPGALAGGQNLIQEIPKTQFQGQIQQDIARMRDWIDQLSGQTASMDGQKESSHDNARLMEQRVVQSNLSQALLYKSLELHELEKTEAWLLMVPNIYSHGYREFNPRGGEFGKKGEVLAVNDRVYTEEGVEVVNSISELPPFKVVVKQSKQGLTVREHDRAVAIDALNVVKSPLKALVLEGTVLETLADDEEEREKIKKINELELEAGMLKLGLEIQTMKAQTALVQQQLEQGKQQEVGNDQANQQQALQIQQQQQQQPQ